MPDGETHYGYFKLGAFAAIPISAAVAIFSDPYLGAGIAIGYLAGRWVDPDLDQPGLTAAEGRMFREMRFLGALFASYWLPYGYLCRRHHRSAWTHFPLLSTALRLVWLFPIIYIAGRFLGIPYNHDSRIVIGGVWLGLSMADAIHYAADMMSGEIGKWRRRSL